MTKVSRSGFNRINNNYYIDINNSTAATTTTTITLVRDDPPTPARGSTPAREISPFRGEALAYYPRHFPIPAFPPYAVRTPHIHGATAYGATIIW